LTVLLQQLFGDDGNGNLIQLHSVRFAHRLEGNGRPTDSLFRTQSMQLAASSSYSPPDDGLLDTHGAAQLDGASDVDDCMAGASPVPLSPQTPPTPPLLAVSPASTVSVVTPGKATSKASVARDRIDDTLRPHVDWINQFVATNADALLALAPPADHTQNAALHWWRRNVPALVQDGVDGRFGGNDAKYVRVCVGAWAYVHAQHTQCDLRLLVDNKGCVRICGHANCCKANVSVRVATPNKRDWTKGACNGDR
jgi:hypothetical protein